VIASTSPTGSASRRAEAPALAAQAAGATAIVPFKIQVPNAVLADLKGRLTKARYPDEIEGAGWRYGANLAYMKELVAYWRDRYDWRAQERRLNQFEQFKTHIDGLDIHFVHRRSKLPNALPLVLVNGWPGSFVEYVKVIEPLTDPVRHGGRLEDAFDVIVPSLPGYGFSDKPRQPGYATKQMAAVFVKLMARLGYTRYGTQGGDWGGPITTEMATTDGAHVVGLYLNQCSGNPPVGVADPTVGLPPVELARMRERQAFWTEEQRGYSIIQGTRPQTLGFALNDSPIGQAAWIIEKFRAWSDVNGNLESKFTKDELLTNVMVYWVTATSTSSARLYFEARHPLGGGYTPGTGAGSYAPSAERIEVPTGCAVFPKEIAYAPRPWVEARYNLKRFTLMPRGGHFPGAEEPELLVEDLRSFFRELRLTSALNR
jgi:microsomal epoxide hydrolase